MRQHLIDMIGRHQSDVKHAVERKGSPYSLVFTKTTGSFERATKRYKENCRLLEIIRDLVEFTSTQTSGQVRRQTGLSRGRQ
jgi:hypothetical protein